MSLQNIEKIVYVEEAKNRDQTEELDRYWLKCMIRDVELIEKIWDMLEIEDIDVGIRVGINRCFSTAVPNQYHQKIEALQNYLRAGVGKDRQKVFHTWHEYRMSQKIGDFSPETLMNLITELTKGELFGKYINVEKPYNIGAIRREKEFSGPFPKFMLVQAQTDLDLRKCIADGYLTFSKKKYIDEISNRLKIK
jgi:hypothetical protein